MILNGYCYLLIIFECILALQDPTCTFAKYPFMIAIKETFSFKHVCGGTLVKPNTVLTLASCIIDRIDIPSYFTAVAGPSTIGRVGSQRITAKKIITHNRFDRGRDVKDVGLLILLQDFELSQLVTLVQIPEQFIPEDIASLHHKAVAVGWGPYHPGKRLTDDNRYLFNPKLNCITLDILSEAKCKMIRKGFSYEPNKICAWVPNGDENMCQGDAGGPLLSNGTQYGIISLGFGCDSSRNPAFYERIDRALDIFKLPFQVEVEFKSSSNVKRFMRVLIIFVCVYSIFLELNL